MISEKEQKIVDAVNYFKGKWVGDYKNLEFFGENFNLFTCGRNRYIKNFVCTKEGFEQCVKEMAEARWMNQSGDFYCYESYKEDCEEPLKEAKMSEEKPVYTQAMKDAGELPSVGMRCKVKNEWLFVGVNSRGSWVLEKPEHFDAYQAFNPKNVKPIDTRTPKQKQVDDIHDNSVMDGFHVNKRYIEWLQAQEHLAEIK